MSRRFGVVGTGSRSHMFITALAGEHADVGDVVAWCEPNPARADYADGVWRAGRGDGPAPTRYGPDELERMVVDERLDAVVVTSPDHTHADVATRVLRAGADVVLEKPMATTADGCRAIADAVAETGRSLVLTFNYRYAPRNAALKEVIASGRIGRVLSLDFTWLLDTMHGADYFRRWHRDKGRSGGLAVHKATHHYDLVNWWLDDVPSWVFAAGRLAFYGDGNARERGLGPRPERGTVDPPSSDPFALDLRTDPRLAAMYWDAERYDGYRRDQDVFAPGVTIEDNLSLLVGYERGPVMTYSLNAHGPWEGYRVAVNGTHGRAELEVVERAAVLPDADGRVVLDASTVEDVLADDDVRRRGERLLVQRHWERAVEVPILTTAGGHGGGDALLLRDVLRGVEGPDPLGRAADHRDGLRSVAVGLAANASMRSGARVNVADLGLPLHAAVTR